MGAGNDYVNNLMDNRNSAQYVLSNPAVVDDVYHPGDIVSGVSAANRQAKNQASLDYAEFVRNEYSAQQQRQFQEYMDSTKTQRAMKDIQAAGLNPWLALQSAGFGGSVSTGSSASSSAGQVSSGQGPAAGIAGLGSFAAGFAALIKVLTKIIK